MLKLSITLAFFALCDKTARLAVRRPAIRPAAPQIMAAVLVLLATVVPRSAHITSTYSPYRLDRSCGTNGRIYPQAPTTASPDPP